MHEGLNSAKLPKSTKYSDYLLLFKLLFKDINSLNFSGFDKECVKSRLRVVPIHLSKISDKNLPDEGIKALKNLIENNDMVIQKADKGKTIMILIKNNYISRLNRILDDSSKFTRLHLEEGKVLNHIFHTEQRIIDLLKSLKNQNEISE